MKRQIVLAVFAALAGSAFATLELPDQLDVNGAGVGRVAASFEAITNEVGYVVDDSFDGEIEFNWTMKWDAFEGESSLHSFALFHFYSIINGELSGFGNRWNSPEISIFNVTGNDRNKGSIQSGTEVETGMDYTFCLKVDYHAGAPDTAMINGGGFIDQTLPSGDWGFHHLRVRAGPGANQVDFTRMTIKSSGVGGIRISSGSVDARFPSEWHARQSVADQKLSWWPPARIQQLTSERNRLLKEISVLSRHDPKFLVDHFGYHSIFEKPDAEGLFSPIQVNSKLSSLPLGSIALAPVFAEGTSYAFPKRFKIEVLDARSGKFEVVVDWMDEDFPDPGPYPVFFSEINRLAKEVRISVPKVAEESDVAFYALGEIYLFRMGFGNQTGVNMLSWSSEYVDLTAPESYTMPSLWNSQYLSDGVDGLGLALGGETNALEDLRIIFDDSSSSDKVQFILDLGQSRPIGRIDLWPTKALFPTVLPSFGFPELLSVELSSDPDFKTIKELNLESSGGNVYRGNLISVFGEARPAQYIRITLKGIGMYEGERILGLGEISVSSNEKVWSINCGVSARGVPRQYMDQLPRLVDGYCQKHRILAQGEWIKGLALRRPLDRRLAVVEQRRELAMASWARTKQLAIIWTGGVVCMALIGGLVVQQRMRRRGMNKLKMRIARDLHDDMGSTIGGLSLMLQQLKDDLVNTEVNDQVFDLALLAREASVSLREVVWVIDKSTIHLPDLIQKMVERAERVLYGVELSVEIPPNCPDTVVPLTFKRHLVMFFKEVIHNCARHAQATRVWIVFSVTDLEFQVFIRDNGCGFDPAGASRGCGLDSLDERAEEMGGSMELTSQLGKGTSIMLKVPLRSLARELSDSYTTSN